MSGTTGNGRLCRKERNMYESLTRHIGKISRNTAGTVITDHSGDGTPERPYQMPFVSYSSEVEAFVRDIYAFENAHRELKLNDYQERFSGETASDGTSVR